MCGIAGAVLDDAEASQQIVKGMLDAIRHRGPDGEGLWIDAASGVALGHRRLSILDLSPAGAQPMHSRSGRYTVVYNGEIYNYLDIRAELERADPTIQWRGHSDTEVLLAGFEAWGIENTLIRANGMFAFAIWDAAAQTLTLARDRFGEKPLYFGWIAGKLAFASEMKALAQLPGWAPRMHVEQVAGYLLTSYVRGPQSAVADVFRLPAGTLATFRLPELRSPMDWPTLARRIKAFWSLSEVAVRGTADVFSGSMAEAVDQLESLILDASSIRMIADVPLGAFLSGGIDSSTIVALMQKASSRPVKTYSIGFNEADHDEAPFARAVARHLGTDHTELYVSAEDALRVVPELPAIYDEPFADNSQIPTLLVSRLARQQVTVALSGDAGDELFAGYSRYQNIVPLWRLLGKLPASGRAGAGLLLNAAAKALQMADNLSPGRTPLSFRMGRLAGRIGSRDLDQFRLSYIGGALASRVINNRDKTRPTACDIPSAVSDPLRRLMFGDQIDYLTDDILVKVDRAAMATSLETRVPLLDPRIVEFSWRLPGHYLHRNGVGKQVLREVLYRHVPRELIERPKQGFAPPMSEWLRGPLRDWASHLLSPDSLRELPMLDQREVAVLWARHQSAKIDAAPVLWNVLMLSAWRERIGAFV